MGHEEVAVKRLREALRLWHSMSRLPDAVIAIESLAMNDLSTGRATRAARLVGAACTIRSSTKQVVPADWRTRLDETRQGLRGAMGNDVFESEHAHGEQLTFEQITPYALGERTWDEIQSEVDIDSVGGDREGDDCAPAATS